VTFQSAFHVSCDPRFQRMAATAVACIFISAVTGPTASAQAGADYAPRVFSGSQTCSYGWSYHGAASGRATRDAAFQAAVDVWAGFVSLKHGTKWSRWSVARRKQVDCQHHGATWACNVSAWICAPVRTFETRHRSPPPRPYSPDGPRRWGLF